MMNQPQTSSRATPQARSAATIGPYDFVIPSLIRFGEGRVVDVGEVVKLYGQRAWIVGGGRSFRDSSTRASIEASLQAAGIGWESVATTSGEPTVDQVASVLASLPQGFHPAEPHGIVVVAVGGGSTIDLAKAVAALATNMPDDVGRNWRTFSDFDAIVVDHLEGVGRGFSIRHWPLPLVALPTTAGTGAEATRNAVLSCPRRRFKKSIRSPMMVPRAVIIDPELTASCDRVTIAAAGLDCITQLIESFICRYKQPLPRSLVLESLPRAVQALPTLLRAASLDAAGPAGSSAEVRAARSAMSHAALVSGIALTNSGLGMAHGVAAALGIECGTPHGVACALLLPVALRVNCQVAQADLAILERAIDSTTSADDGTAAESFVKRIESLCREAGGPQKLAEIGFKRERIQWLAENSHGLSMRGNPVQLTTEELRLILAERFA